MKGKEIQVCDVPMAWNTDSRKKVCQGLMLNSKFGIRPTG